MSTTQRDILNLAFAAAVAVLAAVVTHRFFVPLLWAGVLCIATWPLYRRMVGFCGGRPVIAAAAMTALIVLVFMIPVGFGLLQAGREAPVLAHFIAEGNTAGIPAPGWLHRIPVVGADAVQWWTATLGQPHGLAHLIAGRPLGRLVSPDEVLRVLGTQVTHRLVDIGFSFLCLFFFFKDGDRLARSIARNTIRALGAETWERYADAVPVAIRATVNGLVLVGLGEGVLIGVAYFFTRLPSPVLWAAATGALAIVPFGAPVVYVAAALVLAASGNTGGAAAVAVWGTVVLFVADHFVRPNLIGSATRLPFLAVLFGILGGVETLGLVGLFIGPALMALFVTLWNGREGGVRDEGL
ncbi:AI-2E family transporter [Oxalobacteraceae bacterium OM1]|nr:AI-2E family transporter [Oxalobacteraceae bacterium OM1]